MSVTIGNVIKELKKPMGTIEKTVDMLEAGSPDTTAKGIATTFLATYEVIKQAVSMDINLLITHEGTYYSHRYNREVLSKDPVAAHKRKMIEDSGIAIFRYHDYIHRHQPDGITQGLLRQLNWESFIIENQPTASLLHLPKQPLQEISQYIKDTLNIPYLRVVGDLSQVYERAGVLVGYRGGGVNTIPLFNSKELDLLIIGEGPEWETPEYIRDAIQQGKQKALIVLGHAESEVPGMKFLAKQLQSKYPHIPVQFISEKPVFQIL